MHGSQTARPRPSGQPPRDALSVTFLFTVFVGVFYFLTDEERDMKEFQIWPEGPASSGSDKPQKKRKTVASKEISVWGSSFFNHDLMLKTAQQTRRQHVSASLPNGFVKS